MMRFAGQACVAAFLLACGSRAPALADAPVSLAPIAVDEVRHGHADRLVIWLKSGAGLHATQAGSDLVLTWEGGAALAAPSPATADATAVGRFGQWVLGVGSGMGSARVHMAPGAHPRLRQWVTRLWIDVDAGGPKLGAGQFLPTQATPAMSAQPETKLSSHLAVRTAPDTGAAIQPAKSSIVVGRTSASASGAATAQAMRGQVGPAPQSPQRAPDTKPTEAAAREATPLTDAGLNAEPRAPAASLGAAPAGLSGPTVVLPVQAAAAGFTRSGRVTVVFDAAVPVDLAALKDDPAFGSVTERLLPSGAVLQLRAPAGVWPRLTRGVDGWMLTLAPTPGLAPPRASGHVEHAGLLLPTDCPGGVVTMDDEATGARLLVATQRCTTPGVAAYRQTAEFSLLPSWLGLVILPASDRARLRATQGGFALEAADPPALSLVWQNAGLAPRPDGQVMTRRFDFPALPLNLLRRRLDEALRDAARAPRTDRLAPRLRVAEAMLAGGLDSEALSVLHVAASDDPTGASNPTLRGLSAIASWLVAAAGGSRPTAVDIDAASLGNSDEGMLWRALGQNSPHPGEAASILAPRWQVLLDYPEGLRRKMLPAVANILQEGGQDASLAELLAAFPNETGALDLVRAAQLARHGKSADSLAMFDRLSAGQDRLVRAQAQEAATEQRLAAHLIAPGAAAASFDRQIYAWRGGEHEMHLRLRTAELRAQAGDWRRALGLLQETDALFPDMHGRVRAAQVGILGGLLHGEGLARMSALDTVALADVASGLLGPDDAEASLAPVLADRLLSLDLPDRAEPILRRLLARAGDGPAAAGLSLRLASLLAERNDTAGALGVLDTTAHMSMDADTRESRAVLTATLLARTGRTDDALAQLSAFRGKDALLLQAGIREGTKDFAGAAHVLTALAASPAFAAAGQASQRDIVLRAVRDDAELGDQQALRFWRANYGSLFKGQADEGLFNVLTAEPVRSVTDLGRSSRELGTMRQLSATLAMATGRQ